MNVTVDTEQLFQTVDSIQKASDAIKKITTDYCLSTLVEQQWQQYEHILNWPWCCYQPGDPDNFTVADNYKKQWCQAVRILVEN